MGQEREYSAEKARGCLLRTADAGDNCAADEDADAGACRIGDEIRERRVAVDESLANLRQRRECEHDAEDREARLALRGGLQLRHPERAAQPEREEQQEMRQLIVHVAGVDCRREGGVDDERRAQRSDCLPNST